MKLVCDKLIQLLRKSIYDRVKTTKTYCKLCMHFKTKKHITCTHSKVAILFSGGIDCSLIARLASDIIEPTDSIDLLNISFTNDSSQSEAPDKLSAAETLNELKAIHPFRRWRLVTIQVKQKKLKKNFRNRIRDLIHPLETILDADLGTAFWYAAQGQGKVHQLSYKSTARVVLLGSAADELFGGYKRHRKAFSSNRTESVLQYQFNLDWNRLPYRNLSRDDRILSDHGVTPRSPFIEEQFIQFTRSLSPFQRCCLDLDNGLGDKLMLRIIAYYLQLYTCCLKPKRAIQFGSKIADKKKNAIDCYCFFQ